MPRLRPTTVVPWHTARKGPGHPLEPLTTSRSRRSGEIPARGRPTRSSTSCLPGRGWSRWLPALGREVTWHRAGLGVGRRVLPGTDAVWLMGVLGPAVQAGRAIASADPDVRRELVRTLADATDDDIVGLSLLRSSYGSTRVRWPRGALAVARAALAAAGWSGFSSTSCPTMWHPTILGSRRTPNTCPGDRGGPGAQPPASGRRRAGCSPSEGPVLRPVARCRAA